MKKILAFTAIRSDYDLMSKLYRLLNEDPAVDLRLVVSGAHLSKTYGHSIDQINADRIKILATFNTLIDADTKASRIKTAARLLDHAIDAVDKFSPDLIICVGDREDMVMAALIAGYLRIPCMHFFGGDHASDGHIDNAARHAISKLASVHLVSTKEHAKRLIAMGESKERIFTIGSIALDKFVELKPLSLQGIRKKLGIKEGFDRFALVIFHSMAGEEKMAPGYFKNILSVLKKNKIQAFVGYPNIDPGNKKIIKIIQEHQRDDNFYFYKNLERELFLSVYKRSQFLIGNSSSGILEAASVPIPAVNVGLRQLGRKAQANVVFCAGQHAAIDAAVKQVASPSFLKKIKGMSNAYGDGKSSLRAYRLIKKLDFKALIDKSEDPLPKDKR